VKNRCYRLHFKSVGGILALQEKIAAAWLATREPVTAEVVELGPAEVVPAQAETELPIGTSQTTLVSGTRIHSPAGHLLPVRQPNVVPNENKPNPSELPAPIVETDPNAVTPSTEDQTSSAHPRKRRPAVRITFVKPGEESPFAC
jgi:hypothetical protein